jgi:tripartite-type tricarboxylate transporter receptor subunit TctC
MTVLLALVLALLSPLAAAAEFPERPITMIVPWAPGGSTDQTGRVLAKAAEAHLGQPIVIVNKPGASTTLGMAELAAAKPDGYTIGTLSSTTYMIPMRAGRTVQYDMLKSFSWISYYGDNLIGVAVPADSKWKTLHDLVADGKASPGKIKYGNAGVGTTQHLTMEGVAADTGAKFTYIPQKGSAESVAALLGGHLDFISEVSVWAPHVEARKLRLLAVTTPTRAAGFPDVPTMKELGFSTLRSVQAIIAPAGVPEPVRAKLEAAFRRGLADPAFVDTMKRLHMVIVDGSGADTERIVRGEMERARGLLDKLNLK